VQPLARRVAKAAGTFEQERLGRTPSRVTVVTGRDWMVVCLQSMLAPLDRIVARHCGETAAEIERRQRAIVERSLDDLRVYVHGRTGIELVSAMVSIDAPTGSVLTTFTTTPTVDLFLLGQGLPMLGVPIDAHVRVDGPHAPGAAGINAVGTTQLVRREPFAMPHF
jgi:uncharacterized protein YbcI